MSDIAPATFRMRHVCKTYRMGEVSIHALSDVSLDFSPGEFVVLLGASGSGKSTLLSILGGLDRPTSGEVYYRDHDLATATADQLTRYRREHVGFVFQFYNLIASLTAEENVALVTEIASSPIAPAEALRLVELQDRRHHFPAQLSGGEQRAWQLPAPWPNDPMYCCATNPPGHWTIPPADWCWRSCNASILNWGPSPL
jgi:putative ABC transport system ATP-binding protein